MTAQNVVSRLLETDSLEGLPDPPVTPVSLKQELIRRGYVYDGRQYWSGYIKQAKSPMPIKGRVAQASGIWLRLNMDRSSSGSLGAEVGTLNKKDRRTPFEFTQPNSTLIKRVWVDAANALVLLDALDEFLVAVQKGEVPDTQSARQLFIRLTANARGSELE